MLQSGHQLEVLVFTRPDTRLRTQLKRHDFDEYVMTHGKKSDQLVETIAINDDAPLPSTTVQHAIVADKWSCACVCS